MSHDILIRYMNSIARHLFCCTLLCTALPLKSEVDRKIIGYGWDLLAATPDILLANAEKLDETGLDGVFTEIRFRVGKDGFSSQTIATDKAWPREELERSSLSSLRRFQEHKGLRESLLGAWFMPQRRLDWKDDAAWARFAGNMGELARLAHAAGLKGLFLDTEDYAHQSQFTYCPVKDGMSWDEAAHLARRRGREMSAAIFGAHPSAVLMATWFLSVRQGYALSSDPDGALCSSGDMWPAFLNGMLEAAPHRARFVDGCETGYQLDSLLNEFHLESTRMRRGVERLISSGNRKKFREPFASAFGLYLDMYVNESGGGYYFGPASDGSRLTRLRQNIGQALECSTSGYVWVYGERHSFVEWESIPRELGAFQKRWGDKLRDKVGTWAEQLPGLAKTLCLAKNRDGVLRGEVGRLESSGSLVNLLGNGQCSMAGMDGVPKGFWTWTAPRSPGNVFLHDLSDGHGDKSSIAVRGRASGVVGVDVTVRSGEILYASFWMKGEGGRGSVAFKKGGGFVWKWPREIMIFGSPDVNGWRKGEVFVNVPEGATKATLMASAFLDEGQCVWFDDFKVCRQDDSASR